MPLSEHEQRLLEQIEQSLYADDPKFARSWRSKSVRNVQRTRLLRAIVAFVLGLGLLLGGVITLNGSTVVGVVLGLTGFLFMLGAALFALSTRGGARGQPTSSGTRRRRGPRASLVSRLEERWQRRRDAP